MNRPRTVQRKMRFPYAKQPFSMYFFINIAPILTFGQCKTLVLKENSHFQQHRPHPDLGRAKFFVYLKSDLGRAEFFVYLCGQPWPPEKFVYQKSGPARGKSPQNLGQHRE